MANPASRPTRLRPSAKAVIVEGGSLLVTRNDTGDPQGDWFILPGGGQRPGESLPETLVREVQEETGLAVAVGELLWVREYLASDYAFARYDPDEHGIEFIFRCTIMGGQLRAAAPDPHQNGVEWLPLAALPDTRFFPVPLRRRLAALGGSVPGQPVYLGMTI